MITAVLVTWITVMNPDGIKDATWFFAFGETCVVESLATVETVTPFDETQTLYRFSTNVLVGPVKLCPTGTLFLMAPAELERLQAEERRQGDALRRKQQQIRDTLRNQ
jgi:hypothetical protein